MKKKKDCAKISFSYATDVSEEIFGCITRKKWGIFGKIASSPGHTYNISTASTLGNCTFMCGLLE